jgi:hypothetical protein
VSVPAVHDGGPDPARDPDDGQRRPVTETDESGAPGPAGSGVVDVSHVVDVSDVVDGAEVETHRIRSEAAPEISAEPVAGSAGSGVVEAAEGSATAWTADRPEPAEGSDALDDAGQSSEPGGAADPSGPSDDSGAADPNGPSDDGAATVAALTRPAASAAPASAAPASAAPASTTPIGSALAELDQLPDLELGEHPDVYQRIHAELQDALAAIDDA